jgi:hypothetical protein
LFHQVWFLNLKTCFWVLEVCNSSMFSKGSIEYERMLRDLSNGWLSTEFRPNFDRKNCFVHSSKRTIKTVLTANPTGQLFHNLK